MARLIGLVKTSKSFQNSRQFDDLLHREKSFSHRNTVNIAFSERALSERSHLVNGFRRDRSTLSKEQRAKEPSIQ